MKKLILTALLALMAIAAQAATLTYDVTDGKKSYDDLDGYGDGNTTNVLIFTRLDDPSASTATQMILTSNDLIGILPTTTEAGITRARIKTLSFKVSDQSYAGSGNINMVCYAQNITQSAFPKVDNVEQYMPYATDCMAKLQGDFSTDGNGMTIELTLTFEGEGFLYTGQNILLTTFTEYENTSWDANWWGGLFTFNPGHGEAACIGEMESVKTLQGKSSFNNPSIPFMRFTYEEEVEKLGPTATEGDLVKGHAIGTKANCSPGQTETRAPFNPEFEKATVQSLYLKTQLPGLYTADATGETKANIYSITGFLELEGQYSGAPFDVDVYVQNTELTSFPKDGNNNDLWFDFSNAIHGHATVDWDAIFEETCGYGTWPVTVVFDEPFAYEGESMVMTWVTTSPDCSSYNYFQGLNYTYTSHYGFDATACAVNNEATTGIIKRGTGELPYLEIDYKPLTIIGGETKTVVSFANVKYGVAKAADSKGVFANNVYAEFDLEDASDCGSYDIYLGTKQIGHMTGKHGFVNFLTVSDKDQTISVTPNGGENVIAGTPLTITKDDLNALFVAPEVTETVETMLYGKFDHNDKRVGLQGAAKVKVSAPAPVTAIKLGDNLPIMYQGTSSNGYNDAFEGLIPETATSWEVARDPALNNGEVSFYHNGTTVTVDVVRHEPQITDLSGRITLKPTADYVCLTGATVTEAAPAAASASTAKATVSRTAADNYYVRFNAETPVEFDVTMPTGAEKIFMEEDGEYLMFYTTQSATMQYRLEPTVQAEPGINALAEDAADSSYDNSHEWMTAEKGYINLNLQENKGNKVFVRTVDTNGNARLTAYREIKADGTTSGVADIEADAAAGAEYFNLQGIRVSGELTPGIYIRRQGTTATKVAVK